MRSVLSMQVLLAAAAAAAAADLSKYALTDVSEFSSPSRAPAAS